ncbi:AAA domain-containing protein [Thermoanaerobacter uzonensis DSM 18761]|uniref:AAA domain-containing protein n=1 Tax=Thermoanaerobacter uzonensis DSM 18761 TaxID=1123369 RepID=A0A1M5B5V5_9THEO|nr:AAA family ATPase [Thermoanaerobacter uzonensis]SHF37869.1 AAA domain-containing protein [Thermoanaerobacter uzonensis DSM 18761]
MKVLIVSNDREYVRKAKEIYEDADVALSVESAEIMTNKKKYDFIVGDLVKDSFNGYAVKELNGEKRKEKILPLRQEVIAVYSFKGGVGKTTLVRALFESLEKNIKVLVVDLNFRDGGSDLSFMLDLPVLPHIGMWLKERTKESFFENLIEYSSSVFILQSPPKVSLVRDIEESDVDSIVKLARSKFDIIIFDLPDEFNGVVKTALDNATKIVVLSKGTEGEFARMKEFPYEFLTIFVKPEKVFKKYTKLLNLKYRVISNFSKEIDAVCDFIFS